MIFRLGRLLPPKGPGQFQLYFFAINKFTSFFQTSINLIKVAKYDGFQYLHVPALVLHVCFTLLLKGFPRKHE